MSSVLRRLLRERKVIPSRSSRGMVLKELQAAESDLGEARESFVAEKNKWATVQAYYSAFHSARALLYAKGFREKSHRGLLAGIRELYAREMPESMLEAFGDAMNMREEADYGLVYSEEGAHAALGTAEEFLDRARNLLKDTIETRHPQANMIPYIGRTGAPQGKSREKRRR